MKWYLAVLGAAVVAASVAAPPASAAEQPAVRWYEVKDGKVQVYLYEFWSKTCPHCTKANEFLTDLQKRHDWLKIVTYEVTEHPGNLELYRTMSEGIGRKAGQVPAFFYCKQLDMGFTSAETSGKRLEESLTYYRDELQKQLDKKKKPPPKPSGGEPAPTEALLPVLLLLPLYEPPAAEPELDLELEIPPPPPGRDESTVDVPWWGSVKADEVSLPALTVVLGGLDAFNPCAFFVLMILLGLMLHTGSRGKMLLVGAVFVFVSGLVYFLFMAAWLNLFFLVGHLRVITLAAGVVAVLVALVNIKDYFWFKKGVTLSISDSARSRLVHRMTGLLSRSGVLPVVAGTAALAFAANAYEMLCTSGLPLVYTRVLTLRELTPGAYYGYLALYNVIYVTPLFLIVVGFALTLSGHKLTEYQGRVLKLLSGVMMLALGVILIVAPELLNNLVGAGVVLAAAVVGTAAVVLAHRAIGRYRAARPTARPGLGRPRPTG
jgi:ribosomal protein S27AE